MRRRKPYIDKRLNWRDPNMPIIRKVTLPNGKQEVREIEPKYIEQYYSNKINNYEYWFEGHWSKDPSYFWAKNKNNLK